MQIPATSSASQAASIAAQAASKDSHAEAQQASVANAQAATAAVEKATSANADRDAQGQSDGLPGEPRKSRQDELELTVEGNGQETQPVPQLPDEPPSQLDIIG